MLVRNVFPARMLYMTPIFLAILTMTRLCWNIPSVWAVDDNLPDISQYTPITHLEPYKKYQTATAQGIQFSTPDGYLCRITRAPSDINFRTSGIAHSYYVICKGNPLPGVPKHFTNNYPNDPAPTTVSVVSVDTEGSFRSIVGWNYSDSHAIDPPYLVFDEKDLILVSQHKVDPAFPVLPIHTVIQYPDAAHVDAHFQPVTCAMSEHHSLSCYAYQAYSDPETAGEAPQPLGKQRLNGFYISPQGTHYFSYRP